MAPAYSESDTHDFAKSCVSFSVIDMSIHKLADLRSVLRTGTVKNVYETQRTDDPYTTGLCSVRSKPAAFAQRASHLLYSGASSAAQQATALTKRSCCSAPGAPALADGDYLTRSDSCRAARPAGRHRELKGERTGMYRRCIEDI